MPPAARINDPHLCPLFNGDGSPHTGGQILPKPKKPNVFIGNAPAATVGHQCFCAVTTPPGLPKINTGSSSVFINGKKAARIGDLTDHGGSIISGCMTVLIG